MISPPRLLVQKACPVLTRFTEQREILVFRHPHAGMQLVKGSIEAGEEPRDAALRELFEEAGVSGSIVGDLGRSAAVADGQLWHFFLCEAAGLPDRWVHDTADGGGLVFAFEWWPLNVPPVAGWHPVFVRALEHVRSVLNGEPGQR